VTDGSGGANIRAWDIVLSIALLSLAYIF
jgi:hypothetical protein